MAKVIVLKGDERSAAKSINELFRLAGGIGSFIKKGDKVLLKPNFLNPKPSSTGCTTSPAVIEAVVKAVLKQGGIPIIGESSPVSFDTELTFKRLGIDKIARKHRISIIDLNKYTSRVVKVKDPLSLKKIRVSDLVFEVDKIINLPVMKTHSLTTISLGMKNLMGCVPGADKLVLHRVGMHEALVDLNSIIKPTFTIIDAIVAMEGSGPANGKPKRMGLLIGSGDLLASEIIGARIMGANPYQLKYIQLSKGKELGEYDIDKIEVFGEKLSDVKRKFSLPSSKASSIFSSLVLGTVPLAMSRMGIDISRIAQKLYDFMRPYPEFLDRCRKCRRCIINCPEKALTLNSHPKPLLDKKKCIKCYVCDEVCIYNCVRVRRK
ncbi:DUF362 domain-containing protein [Candidatus Woesearchaeota archaeon]|nr:DUF362 domain-containing protein [Candidatus Woesearchaeota archaeon]